MMELPRTVRTVLKSDPISAISARITAVLISPHVRAEVSVVVWCSLFYRASRKGGLKASITVELGLPSVGVHPGVGHRERLMSSMKCSTASNFPALITLHGKGL